MTPRFMINPYAQPMLALAAGSKDGLQLSGFAQFHWVPPSTDRAGAGMLYGVMMWMFDGQE